MRDADPLTEPWDDVRVGLMHRLNDWAVGHAEVNRQLADWIGLPTSDAVALGHLVWAAEAGDPLSPAGLMRRIGLTSGATTLLVDRLEAAGHVARSRESADRRRVTLRPTPSARAGVRDFLAAAGAETAAVLRETPAHDLAVATAVLERLGAANAAAVVRLRSHARVSAAS
ncbi:hypothetical protein GCM10023340_41620 [Nocardioides marinquilinus]|uniref:HTH marR-type domain-containing protein n=1 Tax=Nocardioides marinquilinus TaxID=1210400 RepID=A0ABP9Q1R1_9ACTN